MALVAAFASSAGAQDPASTPEPKPWTLAGALGDSQRLDWGEGRNIPLLAARFRHPDVLGAGWRLDATYVTTSLDLGLSTYLWDVDHDKDTGIYVRVGAAGELQSALQTPYRYRNGDYLRRRVFYTTTGDLSLAGGFRSEADLDLRVTYDLRRHWFANAPDTVAAFPLPANHVEHRVSLEASLDARAQLRNVEVQRGWGVWLNTGAAFREKWRNWGDTPDTGTRSVSRFQEYGWLAGAVGMWLATDDMQQLRVELGGATGDDLDRISGFGVGSVWGSFPFTWPLPGLYYAEYKADRVLLLSSDYSLDFTTHLRGYLYLDSGPVRAVGDRTRWWTSVGAGVRIGIDVGADSLLPILVRYQWAPYARRGNRSRGGHELAIRILFAL